jgi:hypothetical protein
MRRPLPWPFRLELLLLLLLLLGPRPSLRPYFTVCPNVFFPALISATEPKIPRTIENLSVTILFLMNCSFYFRSLA